MDPNLDRLRPDFRLVLPRGSNATIPTACARNTWPNAPDPRGFTVRENVSSKSIVVIACKCHVFFFGLNLSRNCLGTQLDETFHNVKPKK